MPTLDLSRHIAAGCLVIQKAETQGKYPSQIWLPSELSLERSRWYHLGPFSIMNDKQNVGGISSEDITEESAQNKTNHILFLDSDIQNQLLAPSGCLAQYAGLLRRGWVHMSFAISLNNPEQGVFRVYMLPDDIDNRRIPRSDSSLRKARLNLLGQLDFSRATWEGEVSGTRYPDSVNFDPEESRKNGEHLSLLHMFNNIPSPNPTPEEIPDLDAREAAYRIMDGGIFGLMTTLYTYQRRSAAMMLQREVQQEQVIDPRLVKVVDQLGNPYYYDAVTGTGLKAPRYYDRPCGGILAEEMGAGKTLICLALILATRHIPSKVPDCLWTDRLIVRRRIGTLLDMAAACLTRNSVPWRNVFGALDPDGIEYPNCVEAIRRNKAWYELPPADRRRTSRQPSSLPSPRKIYLSHTSLVIVPPNLIQQWKQEISKHTFGLKIIILDNSRKHELPPVEELIEYDIVLFSSTRFERMCENIDFDVISGHVLNHPIASIRFKRCIVDEGHKLGNSTPKRKSNIHLLVDHLQIEAKWIVTGTPSKGLFGVREGVTSQASNGSTEYLQTSPDLERDDLKRIGSMATLYLQMRPWANLPTEAGDTPADWSAYVMQPRHSPRSNGRANCLKSTLHSLIIRHQLSEIGELFPTVDEKIVVLDGSYQDRLALNLFAMMIIFNSVQSQRTDQDYFFHPRQRKALIELVSNLRQASFFGGSFFSSEEIQKAVETAEEFLKEGKAPISAEDEVLLRDAIQLGKLALRNDIKRCANLFREVPLYVQNFPWNAGKEWSLNLKDGDLVCTDSRIILALQKFLHPLAESSNALQILFKTGKLAARGLEERQKWIKDQTSKASPNGHNKDQNMTLAGNTPVGQDSNSPMRRRSVILVKEGAEGQGTPLEVPEAEIASVLATTQLVSTASAKLSYLIDQIAKHQEHEQIIVFYENDNVAYYLAGVLEIVSQPSISLHGTH